MAQTMCYIFPSLPFDGNLTVNSLQDACKLRHSLWSATKIHIWSKTKDELCDGSQGNRKKGGNCIGFIDNE